MAGRQVGTVSVVVGTVRAIAVDGSSRVLQPRDAIYEGETVVTNAGALATIDLVGGRTVDLPPEDSLELAGDLIQASIIDQTADQVAALQQAIELGADPTVIAEPPAAGEQAGSSGENNGHGTVRVELSGLSVTPESGYETIPPSGLLDSEVDRQLDASNTSDESASAEDPPLAAPQPVDGENVANSYAPVAVDDGFETQEDTALTLAPGDLLGNDGDADGDTLSVSAVGNATNGSVALVDGQVVFTPDPDYSGPASFEYTVDDGNGGTDTALVTVDVLPGNAPPTVTVGPRTVATSVSEISEGYQFFVDNALDVLGSLKEKQALPSEQVNGVGPITLAESHRVTVTFESEGAGYRNAVGWYTVDADGTIRDPQIIWRDASDDKLNRGDTVSLGELPAGTTIGLFVVRNGFNQFGDLSSGTIQFQNTKTGDPANIFDTIGDPLLVHTRDNGRVKNIKSGSVFHSIATPDAGTLDMNADGIDHAVSGFGDSPGQLIVGFEDLLGGGDLDYNDVVMRINVGEATARQFIPTTIGVIDIRDPDDRDVVTAAATLESGSRQPGDELVLGGGFTADSTGRVLDADGTLTGVTVSAFDPTTGELRFDGLASHETYEAILGEINFQSLASEPAPGTRLIQLHVTDPAGNSSNVATVKIVVTDTPKLGTPEADAMFGDDGNNHLSGLPGNDTLVGGLGDDILDGGDGDDLLFGGGQTDMPGDGDDVLIGGAGDDFLDGGEGDDDLFGNDGNDLLDGRSGNDALDGGAGDDVLVVGDSDGNGVLEHDKDFALIDGGSGMDTLLLDGRNLTLDLSRVPDGGLVNLEAIGLTGVGNNTLTLTVDDVLEATDGANELKVFGNNGDSVNSVGQGWQFDGEVDLADGTFNQYTANSVTLLVDVQVAQDIS